MVAYAVDALPYIHSMLGHGYFAGGCRCEVWCNTQDCSGFIVAGSRTAGLPCPCISSAGFAVWGRQAGTLISEAEALVTPLAVAIKGPNGGENGNGPLGHIVWMVGDGQHTYEAMGTRYGIVIGQAQGRGFVRWMKVPGLIYGPKPPPPPPPFVYKETDMVVLPGAGTPPGSVRVAHVAESGRYIEMWHGAVTKDTDGHRTGDPANMRQLHPKNADGSEAWSPTNPVVGVGIGAGGKYLVSLMKNGATYLHEIQT